MEIASLNRQVDTSLIDLLLKAALSSTGKSNIVPVSSSRRTSNELFPSGTRDGNLLWPARERPRALLSR